MLITYARYLYTEDYVSRRVGNDWCIVEKEYIKYYPSGRQNTVVINGLCVKARHCEIVQVFVKSA